MKPKMMLVALVGVMALFLTGAVAQQEQHHSEQSGPQTGFLMGSMMSGGTMSEGMAMCQQMMSGTMMGQQQETTKLLNELLESSAVLEKESDPTVLKNKLAEQRAVLEQLQTKFQQHSEMMQKMMEQMQQHP